MPADLAGGTTAERAPQLMAWRTRSDRVVTTTTRDVPEYAWQTLERAWHNPVPELPGELTPAPAATHGGPS